LSTHPLGVDVQKDDHALGPTFESAPKLTFTAAPASVRLLRVALVATVLVGAGDGASAAGGDTSVGAASDGVDDDELHEQRAAHADKASDRMRSRRFMAPTLHVEHTTFLLRVLQSRGRLRSFP
jgi:hypothetical protein